MKTIESLMESLEITEQQAAELLEVETAYQEYYRGGTCSFKKWNNRIYITFSSRSATANKKKNYYNLEEGLLYDTYVRFEADRTEHETLEEAEEAEEVKQLWNGNDWVEVNKEWCNGISNFSNIDEMYDEVSALKVVYKNGDIVYYRDVHGTWGDAVSFR